MPIGSGFFLFEAVAAIDVAKIAQQPKPIQNRAAEIAPACSSAPPSDADREAQDLPARPDKARCCRACARGNTSENARGPHRTSVVASPLRPARDAPASARHFPRSCKSYRATAAARPVFKRRVHGMRQVQLGIDQRPVQIEDQDAHSGKSVIGSRQGSPSPSRTRMPEPSEMKSSQTDAPK